MTPDKFRAAVIADLGRFTHDPLGFVLWAFPWGVEGTSLEDEDGPDEWQREQLTAIGERLREDPHTPIKDATASGHGIGKSTEVAWLILWSTMTHENTRGVVTANTESQLRSKTWPEVAKWYGLLQFDVLREMFRLEATSLHATEPGRERTWRFDAIPWSERNPEAFAGLHNAGKRIVLLFDEASSIIDAIWDTASGALTDAGTEILWFAYGNPTRNTGRFHSAIVGRHRTEWQHRMIDGRDVKRTNKAQLQAWIETYGEDSDFVRVRVKGQFPRAGSTQFIGSDLVQAARKRDVPELLSEPLIFGVDCARFGGDHSTLAMRRGRDARSLEWRRWYDLDAMTLAGDIALEAKRWHPQAVFVDAGNIGAAVIDRLRQLGVQNVFEVWFGGKGREATWAGQVRVKTKNKRAEMWTTMRAWLATGAIPDSDDLEADLTAPEYGYAADQVSIQLESKKDMRARGMPSPDDADALACTFAEPVLPIDDASFYNPTEWGVVKEYDRYAELDL
ncbi:terminase [Porphyrobacter algicida]|uniref:Terminase n=1 Tax=Qipengyuania algicida TaxID=1836209 RepID=A0A845AEK7_9SPHN|nr:terminase [Qipengyuania algicida]MXP27917.1 terminase [Qipengyuania algicida]